MNLDAGYVCDRGLNPKRPVNQDRLLVIPDRGLFAVFDGVGGQRAGEVASQTAAETIEEALAHAKAHEDPVETIRRAIDFANRDIFEMAESDPAFRSMATTVALIHIDGNRVTVAHVGDSRVYRLEDGRFSRETIDHTDLNDDIRAGKIGKEQVATLESSNVINRALGVENRVEIEVKTIALRDGVRFLLCSDGIYRHMSDDEIARVVAENKEPQLAADELKRIVHERGAEDNLTAVVVQVGRAKRSSIVAIDDGFQPSVSTKSHGVRAARRPNASGARIKVDFERSDDASTSSEVDADNSVLPSSDSRTSRLIMYVLMVLVLVAGSFYAGLRSSDFTNKQPSPVGPETTDSLRTGRDLFERGDYRAATLEFDAVTKKEPSNASAFLWLGRSLLEQHEYAAAARNFEEAVSRQPSLYDGYVWQAAAYEALGEKAKAAAALARSAEERRKQPVTGSQ